MQFSNAIWLWGLTGLIVPIGIHLLSRKAGKVIRLGSIRHLNETSTQQFKAIRLNEFVLLALRCLFIILMVLLLAGVRFNALKQESKLLLIEKGLENEPGYALLKDSLKANGFEVRTLSSGFPTNSYTVISEKVDYWNLMRELKPGGDVVVLSYSYADGFKGKRIRLPDRVSWLSSEPDSLDYVLRAAEFSNDSLTIRAGKSRSDKTSFYYLETSNQKMDSVAAEPLDTISVTVVFDPSYEHDKNIMIAAAQAVGSKSIASVQVETISLDGFSNAKKYNWIVWLSETSPPATARNIILIDENSAHREELFLHNENHTWLLTKRLNEEVALQENLAVQLAMILLPEKKYHDRVRQFDRRALPERQRWSTLAVDPGVLKAGSETGTGEKCIMIALLMILFTERLLAFKRDQ